MRSSSSSSSSAGILALLHFSILVAGFTGLFGKLIDLKAPVLSCYRTITALAILWVIMAVFKLGGTISNRVKARAMLAGSLLFVHWVLFYASIQLSNVSIGVICLAAMGFFTALFEPVVLKRPFSFYELILSFIGLCGLLLIFHFDAQYRLGIMTGIISSAVASAFTITNKTAAGGGNSYEVLKYELTGGSAMAVLGLIVMAVVPALEVPAPGLKDALYLLALASVCTVGLYFMQIKILDEVSAFTVNLSYNLEPVYSIILAMVIFSEYQELGLSFIGGLSLIAISVILQNYLVVVEKRKAGR